MFRKALAFVLFSMPLFAGDAGWWQTQTPKQRGLGPYSEDRNDTGYLTMKDGVQIAYDVTLPKGSQRGEKFPTILRQTRYSAVLTFASPSIA